MQMQPPCPQSSSAHFQAQWHTTGNVQQTAEREEGGLFSQHSACWCLLGKQQGCWLPRTKLSSHTPTEPWAVELTGKQSLHSSYLVTRNIRNGAHSRWGAGGSHVQTGNRDDRPAYSLKLGSNQGWWHMIPAPWKAG